MSQYTAAIPEDGQVRPEIREYFEKFYEVSDSPGDHDKYADFYTKDGKLIMGPTEVNGRDGESFDDVFRCDVCAVQGVPDI